MKKLYIIIGIIAVIALGGLSVFLNNSGYQGASAISRAPDFSLEDYNKNEINLSDFAGKNVIVNSWAIWCPFCVEELKEFAKLQEKFGDQIVIIAIDRAESSGKVKAFTDNLGITDDLIFLLDPGDSFYRSIGGFSMPETIFIDKEGNIVFHKRGPMRFEEMEQKVKEIFGI